MDTNVVHEHAQTYLIAVGFVGKLSSGHSTYFMMQDDYISLLHIATVSCKESEE